VTKPIVTKTAEESSDEDSDEDDEEEEETPKAPTTPNSQVRRTLRNH
jgi:hypothetical protein